MSRLEHHDQELCDRLATNLMGWEKWHAIGADWWTEGMLVRSWDPCCKPDHNWMAAQQIMKTPVPGIFYEDVGAIEHMRGESVRYTIDWRMRVSPMDGELESHVVIRPEMSQSDTPPKLINIHVADGGHPLLALCQAIDFAVKDE